MGAATESKNTVDNHTNSELPTELFGFDLRRLSRGVQFLVCALGLFGFYILNGVCQEYVFSHQHFDAGFFYTLCHFLVYAITAGFTRFISTSSSNGNGNGFFTTRAPKKAYMLVAAFMVATTGLSNESLVYLNYPTQVMFKSCKLLVVMASGIFITGRRYSRTEYFSALMLVAGLITLSWANHVVALAFDTTGVLLVCCALLSDAFVGNLQEKTLREYSASSNELIFFSHAIGSMYLFVVCLVTGQFFPSVTFLSAHPETLVAMIVAMLLGYFGINFFMALLKQFGIFVALTATSCRKVMTILLSFLLFPKPFTGVYLLAMLLVFSGVTVNLYHKNRDAIDSLFADAVARLNRALGLSVGLKPASSGPLLPTTNSTASAATVTEGKAAMATNTSANDCSNCDHTNQRASCHQRSASGFSTDALESIRFTGHGLSSSGSFSQPNGDNTAAVSTRPYNNDKDKLAL